MGGPRLPLSMRGLRPSFRIPWRFAAGVVALLVAAEALAIAIYVIEPGPYWTLGMDWAFYRNLGAHWLADGSFYLPRQLSGPYVATTMVDNLYPPHALLLFVPFVFLPAAFWWAIPITILVSVIVYLRPAPWAWVVMLVLLAWPRSISAFLLGNTDLWIVAIIAAAIRLGWPAVFVTIKPTFAPLVLLGARRPWQTTLSIVAISVLALAALPLWLDYATAMRNAIVDPGYSVGSIPLMLIPVVARLATTRKDRVQLDNESPAIDKSVT
jgi:hypothetical protein